MRKIDCIKPRAVKSSIIFDDAKGRRLAHMMNQDDSNCWFCEGCQWCEYFPHPLVDPKAFFEGGEIKKLFEQHDCTANPL
jgi:hypothetical protein